MSLRSLIIFLFFCVSSKCGSQNFDEKNFTLYSRKDGLSSNDISAVEQDAYGYLWIGTTKGLNRFDGNSFQQFYSDSSKNSLLGDRIFKLKWIDNEQLGVTVHGGGLHIINTRTLDSRNLIIPADSLKKLNKQYRILEFLANAGNVFIVTGAGFYHFNTKDELIFRYDHYSADHLQKKPAAFGYNIVRIDSNTLLVTTYNEGLYVYNIKQKDFHPVSNTDDRFYQQINPQKKTAMITHSDNNSFSLFIPDLNEFSWFNIHEKIKYSLKSPVEPFKDFVDYKAKFVRLNDSVFAINGTNGFQLLSYHRMTNSYAFDPQTYFADHTCNSLFVDKTNRLWIATPNGLFHQKRSSARIDEIITPFQSKGYDSHIRMITLANNKVFAGTNSEGLLVFDRDSLKLLKRIDFSKYGDGSYYPNIVSSIIEINSDTLYVGVSGTWLNSKTLSHGKLKLPEFGSPPHSLDILFKDSRNNLYLKKANKNIYFYRSATDRRYTLTNYDSTLSSLLIGSAIRMSEDREGNIWFIGNGMKRLNNRLQRFDLNLDSFLIHNIGNKFITSNLVFDSDGRMYFGVSNKGLVIYDPGKNTFLQVNRSNGLPDNSIAAVCLQNNKVWVGTESGIANYDLITKKISVFGTAEGISNEGSVIYSLYYDSAYHQLYGAFKNTIFRFDPDKLIKNNSPPVFFIEKINIRGKEPIHHPDSNITVSYKYNNLVINLGAINFDDAYTQLFAYRFIKKGNEPWEEAGSQRSIILSNLTPGNYKLQVKVYNRNKSWPEQIKEINITILPPFWQTIWFYVLSFLLLAGLAYYLHRRRINHVTQKANLDKQLAQTEMKALHSQMNPHFIFNCLNSIREMILSNENEQASLYLSKFARLIRITLNQSSKQFVSLSDTIDYLERYIEMEKIRSNHFSYTIDIDKDLQADEIMVPPMLIQPLIENSIWHGSPHKRAMHIKISFHKNLNGLVCRIEDDGIGIDESIRTKENLPNEQSVGLANIKQRIHLLNEKHDLHSTIKIEDKSTLSATNETGTIVTLHMPIKTNESLWTT